MMMLDFTGLRRYLWLLIFLFPVFVAAAGVEPDRPNIVIIYADDLGIGDVSAYGMGTLETPNIDRIAARGIRFERGYATSATVY